MTFSQCSFFSFTNTPGLKDERQSQQTKIALYIVAGMFTNSLVEVTQGQLLLWRSN